MDTHKKIDSITLEELFSQDTAGSIPILIDISQDDIVWPDDDYEQIDGHLRLINANYGVKYKGDYYMPSRFVFTMPSEDGKTVGNTSITISAVDQRVIEVIRSVESKPIATIIAAFMRTENNTVIFSKLYQYKFEMSSVSWDGVTAKWNLTFDPAMSLNVPRDTATGPRCPGISNVGR